MKITSRQLMRIIREELSRVSEIVSSDPPPDLPSFVLGGPERPTGDTPAGAMGGPRPDQQTIGDIAGVYNAMESGDAITLKVPKAIVYLLQKYADGQGWINNPSGGQVGDIGDVLSAVGNESITEAIDRAVAVLIGMGITAVTGIVAYAIHKDRSVKVRINPTGVPGQEGEIMIGGPGESGEEEVVIDEPEPPKQIEQIPDIEAEYEDVVVGDKDAIVAEVIRRLTRKSLS